MDWTGLNACTGEAIACSFAVCRVQGVQEPLVRSVWTQIGISRVGYVDGVESSRAERFRRAIYELMLTT